MLILIKKDAHTIVPREVKDLDEARSIAATTGLAVEVVGDDGVQVPLAEFVDGQAKAEQVAASAKPAAKPAAKSKKK